MPPASQWRLSHEERWKVEMPTVFCGGMKESPHKSAQPIGTWGAGFHDIAPAKERISSRSVAHVPAALVKLGGLWASRPRSSGWLARFHRRAKSDMSGTDHPEDKSVVPQAQTRRSLQVHTTLRVLLMFDSKVGDSRQRTSVRHTRDSAATASRLSMSPLWVQARARCSQQAGQLSLEDGPMPRCFQRCPLSRPT